MTLTEVDLPNEEDAEIEDLGTDGEEVDEDTLDALTLDDFWTAVRGGDENEVTEVYGELSRGDKTKAARELRNRALDALSNDNFEQAKAYQVLVRAVEATKAPAGRAPADPHAENVSRAAALALALDRVQADIPAEHQPRIVEALNAAKADQAHPVAVTADKLVSTRIRKVSTGEPRGYHNVATHIEQVFANKPAGTWLSVQDIANESSDEYGESKPGLQSVNARLNGNFSVEGLAVEHRDGKLGVVKS